MFQFNARQHNPEQSPDAVPAGQYRVVIDKTNQKETKAKDGGFLAFAIKIIEGQFAGRVITHNVNLWNKNAQTVEIAHKQMSAICHAIGVLDVQGQDGVPDNFVPMLHNRPFRVDVSVEIGRAHV